MISWAHACDIGYAVVGLVVVYAISLHTDAATGSLIGALMVLCYLAGGQKFRRH
jgi:hypothetical protein